MAHRGTLARTTTRLTGGLVERLGTSPYPDRTLWMTEYAECHRRLAGQRSPGYRRVALRQRDRRPDSVLNGGASAALAWDADNVHEHCGCTAISRGWGLLALSPSGDTYTPKVRYATVAQVFKFAPPGWQRRRQRQRPSLGLRFPTPRPADRCRPQHLRSAACTWHCHCCRHAAGLHDDARSPLVRQSVPVPAGRPRSSCRSTPSSRGLRCRRRSAEAAVQRAAVVAARVAADAKALDRPLCTSYSTDKQLASRKNTPETVEP